MELIQYSTIPTYLILQNFEKQMVPWKIQYYQRAFVWMVTPQDALGLKSKKYLNYCIQDSVNLSW